MYQKSASLWKDSFEKILDDSHVMLRITACRDENNIGRLILADPNYWRKIDNGTD